MIKVFILKANRTENPFYTFNFICISLLSYDQDDAAVTLENYQKPPFLTPILRRLAQTCLFNFSISEINLLGFRKSCYYLTGQ